MDRGWDATGTERSGSAIERAKELYGVDLVKDLDDTRYDVITLWDVVEHLRDPEGIFRMLREHLAPGGYIFVETGNYESWLRLQKGDAWELYLFDHQYYFSPASLSRVLSDAGYTEFQLLKVNRVYPPPLRGVWRNPVSTVRSWLAWAQARIRWPGHGDVNIMVAAARRPTDG